MSKLPIVVMTALILSSFLVLAVTEDFERDSITPEELNKGDELPAPENIFQQILQVLIEIRDLLSPSTNECQFENYFFEQNLNLGAQSSPSFGSGLVRYYDFESSEEVIDGTFDLINFEGNPSFTTVNALIGNSGRVTTDNNWKLLQDNPTNLGASDDRSLNFWVRPENVEDQSAILWKDSSTFYIQFSNNEFFFNDVIGSTNGPPATNNQWFMVTLVKEGNVARIYVNSILQEQGSSTLDDNIDFISIGSTNFGNGDLIGLFDEMTWWNRVLTNSEIQTLYNNGQGFAAIDLLQGDGTVGQNVTILLPKEIEFSNFTVSEAIAEATCTGTCSYEINNEDCGNLVFGDNQISQNCLDSIQSGFNDLRFIVDDFSEGSISNLKLKSQVLPANC